MENSSQGSAPMMAQTLGVYSLKDIQESNGTISIPLIELLNLYRRSADKDTIIENKEKEIERLKNEIEQLKQSSKNKQPKSDSRKSPTYALSDYGIKNAKNAEECAKKAYIKSWGSGFMNAYLIRALFEKGIIKELKATSAVRLLMYWELLGGEVDTIADNINNKLKKIQGDDPQLWNVDQVEKDAYNNILDAFEDNFPTPITE